MTTVIVLAKECLPGRVKTRLHPPFSLEEAARIASASLTDTLAVTASLAATRRILCYRGTRAPAGAEDFEVLPQASGGLDERIAAAFDASDGPTVLIGMDTPQITADLLTPVIQPWPEGVDAWFGAARDGGFWALGLAEPVGDLIRGVPMSRSDTGRIQRQRLLDAGLRVRDLPELTDLDTVADLDHIVGLIPCSATAAAAARIRTAHAA